MKLLTEEQAVFLMQEILKAPGEENIEDDEKCKCIDSYGAGVRDALKNCIRVVEGFTKE